MILFCDIIIFQKRSYKNCFAENIFIILKYCAYDFLTQLLNMNIKYQLIK